MPQVLVPLATGFEEIEAVTIIDVLRRGGIKVIMASVEEEYCVQGAHGIVIECSCSVESLTADELDMIVLPGGWDATQTLSSHLGVQSLLQSMDAQGKAIGAICAAPYALYTAGVLKQEYTCYPSIENHIDASKNYHLKGESVVYSGNVITSRGPATAMDFALSIVQKLAGESVYTSLLNDLLVI
jgi:4-methyl-5(b-hydroxyethyl)-thiazole monophosphate biosynthesis